MTPKRRILPVFVPHAGCPHTCVFCNQRRISGAVRPTAPEEVREMLKAAEKTKGAEEGLEVAFYGGSFTAIPQEEQRALLETVAGKVSSIRVSTRPDAVGEEALALLREYGVETVELGVQSMDPEVLRLSQRGHTPEDVREGAKRVRENGFRLMLQMMTGLPGDTPERSIRTAEELIALRPEGVRIYPTVVIPGTELWEMWKTGEYVPQTVDEAAELCAALWERFDDAGIPVIRCGLNPTEELSAQVAAGPYHPAFGELVQGKRYLAKERELLRDHRGENVVLGVARGQISAATGQKRCNAETLKREFALGSLAFRETDTERGNVIFLEEMEGNNLHL